MNLLWLNIIINGGDIIVNLRIDFQQNTEQKEYIH